MKRIAWKNIKRTKIVVLTHGIYYGKLRTIVNIPNKIISIIFKIMSSSLSLSLSLKI